jgi:hypothetical protein
MFPEKKGTAIPTESRLMMAITLIGASKIV